MPQEIRGDAVRTPGATFAVRPIGYVGSAYARPEEVPHSHQAWTEGVSRIRLLARHAGGLRGLEGYSHVIVLFWVHRAREWKMPRHHHKPPHVKVFATRMPVRPNPIGLSVVELLSLAPETGELVVRGLDALDGTPVLDIKPYIPNFDSRPGARLPRWVAEHLESHFHEGPERTRAAAPGLAPTEPGGPVSGRHAEDGRGPPEGGAPQQDSHRDLFAGG